MYLKFCGKKKTKSPTTKETSTLRQRKGRAPPPSITWSHDTITWQCNAGPRRARPKKLTRQHTSRNCALWVKIQPLNCVTPRWTVLNRARKIASLSRPSRIIHGFTTTIPTEPGRKYEPHYTKAASTEDSFRIVMSTWAQLKNWCPSHSFCPGMKSISPSPQPTSRVLSFAIFLHCFAKGRVFNFHHWSKRNILPTILSPLNSSKKIVSGAWIWEGCLFLKQNTKGRPKQRNFPPAMHLQQVVLQKLPLKYPCECWISFVCHKKTFTELNFRISSSKSSH